MTGSLAAGSLLIGMGLASLADSMSGYCLAAAVPGEIILFIAARDLVSRLAPPGARGRYAGLWGSNLAPAVVTATWVICGTGVLGAVLCRPLHSSIHTP
ncbi:hypothetical protein [Streptomyces virginiae]|uniref:hypothetical protein n=1 Tax=Streptomyces virginiae TaxID=1961 RepID=UPI00386B070D|nr:hypothetical protein OG253_32810 [Streptomyces virginiae]